MNYYMYLIDILKDVLKVVDYLEVGMPHHKRSYFGGGGIESEHLHRRQDRYWNSSMRSTCSSKKGIQTWLCLSLDSSVPLKYMSNHYRLQVQYHSFPWIQGKVFFSCSFHIHHILMLIVPKVVDWPEENCGNWKKLTKTKTEWDVTLISKGIWSEK